MALQVGYGLVHDLWAIAAALGDEGLGCVSVVEPQLDVGMLHRQLHRAHVPGIKKVRVYCQCTSCCRLVSVPGTSTMEIQVSGSMMNVLGRSANLHPVCDHRFFH